MAQTTSHSPADEIPFLDGLHRLAELYDGFILDLWGVLHDGVQALPGVAACLERLRAAGKRTCLLSNAPRRADAARDQIAGFGLTEDLYDHLYTSGEATYELLRDRPDAWARSLGTHLLHIGPERDRSCFEGLSLTPVDEPGEASFVLNTGPIDRSDDIAAYRDIMTEAARRDLPMVCANPDRVVHVGAHLVVCAGALADEYAAMGGRVRRLGKPYPDVYRRSLALMGLTDANRVVAIGDSLTTDIAGAHGVGITGVLVADGIHRDELGMTRPGTQPAPAALAALCHHYGIWPAAAMTRMRW